MVKSVIPRILTCKCRLEVQLCGCCVGTDMVLKQMTIHPNPQLNHRYRVSMVQPTRVRSGLGDTHRPHENLEEDANGQSTTVNIYIVVLQ